MYVYKQLQPRAHVIFLYKNEHVHVYYTCICNLFSPFKLFLEKLGDFPPSNFYKKTLIMAIFVQKNKHVYTYM